MKQLRLFSKWVMLRVALACLLVAMTATGIMLSIGFVGWLLHIVQASIVVGGVAVLLTFMSSHDRLIRGEDGRLADAKARGKCLPVSGRRGGTDH